MDVPLPPGLSPKSLIKVPQCHREDAVQEAWVAHLEGTDPAAAIRRYVWREIANKRGTAYEQRVKPQSQLNDAEISEVTKQGLDP